MIILETTRAHLQCSKVTKFKPAWSCQSLLLRNTHIHTRRRVGKLVNESTHRRTQHVGLGAMWCEINGGGVRKRGRKEGGKQGSEAKGRQQRKKKGIHASLRRELTAPAFLQTFKSEPSTTTVKTLPHPPHTHTHTTPTSVSEHPQNSCQLPLDPSGGECVCACTLTTCHASTVCAWAFVSLRACMLCMYEVRLLRAHYFCFLYLF